VVSGIIDKRLRHKIFKIVAYNINVDRIDVGVKKEYKLDGF